MWTCDQSCEHTCRSARLPLSVPTLCASSSMPYTNSTKCCTTNLCLFPTVGPIGCTRRASCWVQSIKGFESLLGSQTHCTQTHNILHYPHLARVINPKAIQNHGEEALMGTVTNTWQRSISGRYKKKVQVNVLTKRIVALLLRLALLGS